MARFKLAASTLALVAAVWAGAQAGTVIVIDTWAYDQYSESGTATVYLGEDKLRVEFAGKDRNIQAIFDMEKSDAPVMWIIEPATETYTKMDLSTLKKTEGKMRAQFEQFENYLATMSAEERAEFTKQYKKQLRQAEDMLKFEERKKKTSYEKVGEEKINEWTCVHLKGMLNKEMRKEAWVAPWSGIGLAPEDTQVLAGFSNAFGGFAGEMVPFRAEKVEGSDGAIEGFPVRLVFYEDGSKIIKQEVKEIRKEDLEARLFEVPEGYTEESPELE
jgi:hypothetical protein